MQYELRPAAADGQPFLAQLFHELHAPEFAPLQLPEEALKPLLDMQHRAQAMSYAAQFPAAESSILTVDRRPVGRVLVDREPTAWRLVDIGILPEFQGQGIGGSVVRALLSEAVSAGAPLLLSVRFGNPALRLYQRLGFRQTGGDGANIFMEAGNGASEIMAAKDEVATRDVPGLQAMPEDPEGTPPGTSSGYFQRLVGETLFAGDDGIPVQVSDTQLLPAPKSGVPVELNDSFVTTLSGPRAHVLPSASIGFRRSNGETFEAFIVPTGFENEHMRYEITFNRMQPRATSAPA